MDEGLVSADGKRERTESFLKERHWVGNRVMRHMTHFIYSWDLSNSHTIVWKYSSNVVVQTGGQEMLMIILMISSLVYPMTFSSLITKPYASLAHASWILSVGVRNSKKRYKNFPRIFFCVFQQKFSSCIRLCCSFNEKQKVQNINPETWHLYRFVCSEITSVTYRTFVKHHLDYSLCVTWQPYVN